MSIWTAAHAHAHAHGPQLKNRYIYTLLHTLLFTNYVPMGHGPWAMATTPSANHNPVSFQTEREQEKKERLEFPSFLLFFFVCNSLLCTTHTDYFLLLLLLSLLFPRPCSVLLFFPFPFSLSFSLLSSIFFAISILFSL